MTGSAFKAGLVLSVGGVKMKLSHINSKGSDFVAKEKMTPFEARHNKVYGGFSFNGRCLVSAEQKIAEIINTDWVYSMHWPKDIGIEWKVAVQSDLSKRVDSVKTELKRLEAAQRLLDSIEV